ncbi:NAD(P)-binding protein [Sphingorhabdus sp.]|jgi:cation diffusion facilitator CzcD-associated flavoprotein CzcO|uniref:NAD(P)-binding protein n=1 Tax=Sphingorhabdus sp. TaxID=1902408 RepID=UPI0037CAB038
MIADILIIGGGIGGLSIAADLSAQASVIVLEAMWDCKDLRDIFYIADRQAEVWNQ